MALSAPHKFYKVTWQVVAAVNQGRKVNLLVVPHIEPDYRTTARAHYVQNATSRDLPACWLN